MLFEKFSDEIKTLLTNYLNHVYRCQIEGRLDSLGGRTLYPNILLLTHCDGYYIAELIGANEKFNGLTIKKQKEKSVYRYLSQFDESKPDPMFTLNGAGHRYIHLCLSHDVDYQEVSKRFPHIDLYETKIGRIDGRGSIFDFGDNFESCSIENCVLINRSSNVFRCKSILAAYFFKSSVSKTRLSELFAELIRGEEVSCVHTAEGQAQRLIVGGQLQSMVLSNNLHETTIGEFIKLHPEVFKTAFNTEHFEYEPYLEWLDHDGTCTDTAINPDLLVKRRDGFYDIYDLKTAALNRASLTKSNRSRRRFIDYVEEGISQLANYREYFEYKLNSEHAKAKYGIEVNDPKLVLVVGTWENLDIEEVNQACRKYRNVQVVDYDTVCQMFIGVN